ncbi:hypothetical protein OCU04_006776 [Sclerotinia nivalis]|uniref:Heterokaryon incompatibility domain-containing protein n=1 Tax=Sclerotinia nivalis TaxID=352851 RepID=A0A9X0AKH4_9HELO|nr:hypothetical protein OCU04_006776 [Sclerotinia nivalis]
MRVLDLCASWFNLGRIPVVNDRVSVASLNRLHELIDLSLREKPIARTVDGFLPTRLLDLCPRGVADLRLVVTNEDPDLLAQDTSQKRYAALSYCWGPADKAINQLKTTRDVLDEHLSGIQLEKVPQTVSDAICVCRRLGIRYLWVDALCIIQGDEADWAKESFQMSEVYSNSFIALCIIQGDSCSSGFLRTNYSSHTVKIRFQSKLDSSISGYLHLRMLRSPRETLMKSSTHTGRPVGNSDDPASIDFSKALWGTRAWTFQEDEMSPRKLYFGDSMFYMSCGTLSEAADGSPFDHKRHLGEFISLNETLCSWYNLVSLYVARELSHEQDRLPAISALARSVCDHFPDQKYLAGLWGSDLHKGLLWTTTSWMEFEDYYKPQSHGYVAPSWSWACRPAKLHLIAGLTHHNVHFWPEFTLHGADISFNPLNPYGLVSEGRLSVSAKVFKLPVDKTGKARVNKSGRPKFLGIVFNYNLWSENDEYIAHLFLDWDYHSALHDNGGYPRGPIDQMSMVLITRTSLDQHFMFRSYDTTDQEVVLGILVRLVAGTEGDYERLGMWYSENKGLGGKKFWQNIPLQDLTLV